MLPRHIPPMKVARSTPSEIADDQREELKPDDLVDERRAAAAYEKENQPRKVGIRRIDTPRT